MRWCGQDEWWWLFCGSDSVFDDDCGLTMVDRFVWDTLIYPMCTVVCELFVSAGHCGCSCLWHCEVQLV